MGIEMKTSNRSQHETGTGASKRKWQKEIAKRSSSTSKKDKPAKTKVSRKIQERKHARMQIMLNNPLTNVYTRLRKNRSTSLPLPTKKKKYTKTMGKTRSTSRDKAIKEVEK